MKILGISHDLPIATACVTVDGNIVAAMAEERLDRIKQSRAFPVRAIKQCLQQGGLELSSIDEIAISWNPSQDLDSVPVGFLTSRRWRTEHLMQVPAHFVRQLGASAEGLFTQSGMKNCPPVTYVNHYLAHAGNAVFLSPFDECAVLILDGRGEKQTELIATYRDNKIELVDEVFFPHSLGLLYGTVTEFLGFRPDSDEWKVMALAAFGKEQNPYLELFRQLVRVSDCGKFELDLDYFQFYNYWDRRMYSDRFVKAFGAPRASGGPYEDRHYSLAAALQQVFEETVARICAAIHERTGMTRLVAAGGCFMNSVFNGKIEKLTPFRESFVSSCPDDSGTSIGAAHYLYSVRTGLRPAAPPLHNYWGQAFTDEECQAFVQRYKLPNATVVPDPSKAAAEDLVAGRLIGWFQGRAEFGQRALGHRSILADPRLKNGKDLINAAVKYRESFRPFAPAVLASKVEDWFECPRKARVSFMERVFPIRSEKRSLIPSVVHQDGTGRLQTVDAEHSPRFHDLIRAFEERTDVPIVLNTSFNLNGEPIVNSPEDAIRTFYSCGLDVLYLGNVRISK